MINIIDKIKTHKVEVSVSGPFLNLFLTHLYRLHINISNIKYIDENRITFITNKENIKKIKKNFKDYKIKIISDKGLFKLKPLIFQNKIFLTCLFLGIVAFFIFQNIIVEVNVIHSDKMIRELVEEELAEYGVKRLTFKKSYKNLQKIKNKILDKYPDKLEWIEIENVGMTYQVRIEQRIITKIKEDNSFCNIVASKSGIITKIISKKGMNLKSVDDYVSQGDIVIAGDISTDEEVKQSVCAKGEVYGEVWYNVSVNIPLNYEKTSKTGKMRYNIVYDNQKETKTIFKPRFKNYGSKRKKLFSLFNVSFYLEKEYEVKKEKKKYTKNEAINEALKQAKEKMNLKLNDKERIITQKVLNKEEKNSKMEVEIFVSVEEQIGSSVKYSKPPEEKALE